MKRLAIVFAASLLAAIALPPRPAAAQDGTAVTGVGEGNFPSGVVFQGVSLNGLQFEKGIVIAGDGSATGEFHTLLLGALQNISLDGKATSGYINADGSATFDGVGRIDLGNGQILTDVPFSVTATSQGLQLSLDGTTLPEATLIVGGIAIE